MSEQLVEKVNGALVEAMRGLDGALGVTGCECGGAVASVKVGEMSRAAIAAVLAWQAEHSIGDGDE